VSVAAALALLAALLAGAGLAQLGWAAPRRPTATELRTPRLASTLLALIVRAGATLALRTPPATAERLRSAGVLSVAPADFVAIKGGCALAGLLTGLALAPGLPARLPFVAMLALPAAGFLAPDLWLHRRARARARAIEGELPEVLELLRVAVAAGLPVARALVEVGRRHPGLLAVELRRAAGQLALGATEDTALGGLELRARAAGVPSLVASLRRARRLGSPLAGTLAAQAEQARARRAQRAAERAARAGPKIQLVVALLLVPSALLLVAAALVPALTAA
jgi:tight adherence protein C